MTFAFHPEAQDEFEEAVLYYEGCEPGLGWDFALEVRETIQNVITFPRTWPALEGDVRRCLTHRFPYGVLYSIEGDAVLILAVMHLHRDPGYWKGRRP